MGDNNIGFWSPRTASVDWCENNYVYSYYIAEFWNTMSSIPLILLGFYGVLHSGRLGFGVFSRHSLCFVSFIVIGIGSALFHGTLLYTGQFLDEVPMIWGSLVCLYTVLEIDQKGTSVHQSLRYGLIAYGLFITCGKQCDM
jgi:dihydroceramidase